MKKFPFHVVVGNRAHPAETTCSMTTLKAVRAVKRTFEKGGSMWRLGDEVDVVVYLRGSKVPDEVAAHVVTPVNPALRSMRLLHQLEQALGGTKYAPLVKFLAHPTDDELRKLLDTI